MELKDSRQRFKWRQSKSDEWETNLSFHCDDDDDILHLWEPAAESPHWTALTCTHMHICRVNNKEHQQQINTWGKKEERSSPEEEEKEKQRRGHHRTEEFQTVHTHMNEHRLIWYQLNNKNRKLLKPRGGFTESRGGVNDDKARR